MIFQNHMHCLKVNLFFRFFIHLQQLFINTFHEWKWQDYNTYLGLFTNDINIINEWLILNFVRSYEGFWLSWNQNLFTRKLFLVHNTLCTSVQLYIKILQFFSKNVFQIQREDIQTRSPAKRKTRKAGEVYQTNYGLVLL